jgi:GDP-L-fucose synthase
MDKHSKIYVAGHRGLVGSAIVRKLEGKGYENIIVQTHSQLDLTRQKDVEDFFAKEKPEYVFLAAAKVGGIGANSTYPAEFFYQNMSIALNVIDMSYRFGVTKLLNLGSSCIYPRLAPQPLKEEYLLTGLLEPMNEAYALAKISAIKMCRYYNEEYGTDFISVMPTNLYGIGDSYDPLTAHVLPAMISKFYEAKVNNQNVILWGDGSPYREFLFSEDCADACIMLMEKYNHTDIGEFINIGSSQELTISNLAEIISSAVGFRGTISWDISKPNGTPRKLLDTSRIRALGWKPETELQEGIRRAYKDFLESRKETLE